MVNRKRESVGRRNLLLYPLIGIPIVLAGLRLLSNVNNISAESTNRDVLDVSFAGVFSTKKGYTNPTGEMMDGDLTRRTGDEKIVEGKVIVNGKHEGINFNPRASLHPETANVLDHGVVVEVKFKPDEEQKNLNTIISVGGNLYVRYISSTKIEYGFDVNKNNNWTSIKQRIAAAEVTKEHTIAIAYEPTKNGAILHAFLNGIELASAISKEGGAAWSTDVEHEIGIGNDVHTAALDRGFKGAFSRVVVTSFEGEFQSSLLKTMKLSTTERNLLISGLGTLDQMNYMPAEDEIIDGALEIAGGEIVGLGRLDMSGKDSHITFTPTNLQTNHGRLSGDYITEIVIAPTSMAPGTVLMDVAGTVKIRKSIEEDAIDILVEDRIKETIELPAKRIEEYVHLSLLYKNVGKKKAKISLLLDEEQIGKTLMLTKRPKVDVETVTFAGKGTDEVEKVLKGEVYGVAFTAIDREFNVDLLGLLGGRCTVPTDLEPGYQIKMNVKESSAAIAAKASLVRPKPKQVAWQEYEQTAFIHYGINTYYGVEWGDLWKHDDPEMFYPTDLDTDQWARSLRDSGFKMAVLTAKHHDGFALYPSRYTDFGVKNSPWRDGKGDVLREFVDSMRKYGIKVGIYLSPADHGAYREGIFANGSPRSTRTIPTLVKGDDRIGDSTLQTFNLPATDYGSMLLNQLYEVLTEYGEVDEVWFDGAQGNIPGNKAEKYDWDSFYTLINQLAPEAVIAVTGDDVRWVGNESGWARENEWSVIGSTRMADGGQAYHPSFSSPDLGSRLALTDAAANGMKYLTWWPAEVDVSIRDGWFHHEDQQPKSIATLRDIYYQSVARNSVLLMNIPPNKQGKFADVDVTRLKEWHKSIHRDFAINHAIGAEITSVNGLTNENSAAISDGIYETSWQAVTTQPSSITFKLDADVKVDRVVLQENINHGQQVESFAIDVLDADGNWEEIYANEVIGYKRIASLPEAVTGKEFRVRILKSRGIVHLAEIGLYETLPSGKAMVQLSGMKTAIAGESFVLNYGLSEQPKEMVEGIHRQEVTLQYDTETVEFDSVQLLKQEEHQIVETDEKTPGEIRIIVESKEQLMKKDGEIVKLNWRIKNKLKQTTISVSKAILIDQEGLKVEAVGGKHIIKIKEEIAEEVGI